MKLNAFFSVMVLFVCLVSSMEELTNYTAYNLFWTVGIELTIKIVA